MYLQIETFDATGSRIGIEFVSADGRKPEQWRGYAKSVCPSALSFRVFLGFATAER